MTSVRKQKVTGHNSSRTTSIFASLLTILALTLGQVAALRGQPARAEGAKHSSIAHALISSSEYPRRPSKDALKWADGELKKMSLDEKIGQLISIGINASFLNQESAAFKAMRR